MVSALPSRTARRRFSWFWQVKVDPGRLVYRDKTWWSLSFPHVESETDPWELGCDEGRSEGLRTYRPASLTYRHRQGHEVVGV